MQDITKFNEIFTSTITPSLKSFLVSKINEAIDPMQTFQKVRDILGGHAFGPNVAVHKGKDAESKAEMHRDFLHGLLIDSGYKKGSSETSETGISSTEYKHKDKSKVVLNSGNISRGGTKLGHFVGYTHSAGNK